MSDETKEDQVAKDAAPKAVAIIEAGGKVTGLIPRNIEGLWRLAKLMSASGMMPKGVSTPEQVAVAIQQGLEIGLLPMQAVQNIAVINGRPSLWGDAVPALVRGSGLCESLTECPNDKPSDEYGWTCRTKRKGDDAPVSRTFTVALAKKAGLWGKSGPWQTYPERMLQMRARSWCLRDVYADVLKGMMFVEEARDIIDTEYEEAPGGGDLLSAGRHSTSSTRSAVSDEPPPAEAKTDETAPGEIVDADYTDVTEGDNEQKEDG